MVTGVNSFEFIYLNLLKRSIDKGDDSLSATHRLVAELLPVAFVNGVGTGHQIGRRPPDKDPCGRRSSQHGKSRPLHQLAEVIARGDITVHATRRQVVLRVTRLAQMTDHMVGMQVDAHPNEEQQEAQDRLRTKQETPSPVIQSLGRIHEQAGSNQPGVQHIEHDAHPHDAHRHAAFPLHQQGEDERALEVVQQEQQNHCRLGGHHSRPAKQPADQHPDKGRCFHQYPRQLVVERQSPRRSAEHAITGLDKIERHEDQHSHSAHRPQKTMKLV